MPTAAKIQWPQGQPLFEVQWRAVAESLAGNGVRSASDLEVTATSTDLEIEVASGTAFYLASESTLGAAETHTLSAGDGTYDRWDTVYIDTSTDSSGVREGTPAADPEPPDVQGDELLLAVVYVPQNATDVPDSDVLNWRAQFSNEAEEVHYDDSTGTYSVSSVDAALDELQEAAQISAYPLAQTDLATGSVGSNEIIDGSIALADLANPYGLSDITDMDANGTDLTDSAGPGVVYDASAGVVVQSVLGGPPSSLTSYPLPIGDLASPFALPGITDMDVAGDDLVDGSTTVWDTSAKQIPRTSLDDERVAAATKTAGYTTNGEEVIPVDTSGGSFTVTLASADTSEGNFITFQDVGGATGTNALTIDTEGGEAIDSGTSTTLETDFGAKILYSDGTQWYTAGGSGAGGVGIEDNGATILDPATGIDFGTDLAATDNGDGTVTVDSDASGVTVLDTGTFTHTGGSATSETVAAVTTDQLANLYVEVGVDSDPSFSADYAWDYTWGEAWDDANSEKDVTIDATWDTDPGSGNDVVLDYRIYTLDVSVSKSRIQDLVDSPNGNVPTALLEDTESIEVTVPVPDGKTLKVYRWGAYKLADSTAPTGLDVQLVDDGGTVQASANTVNSENTSSPVASHGNTSGSISIYKLRIKNGTGSNFTTDGVGGIFAYVVE